MFKIILGLSIILVIVLLTVFVLSFQHITFKKDTKEEANETKEEVKETKEDTNEPTEEPNTTMTEANDIDQLATILTHKEPDEKRCCSIQKFDCSNKSAGCKSGIEKRCGVFAEKSCEEPMYACEVLGKDKCESYPTSVYCQYDYQNKQCVGNTINSQGGSEISCNIYDRLVNDNKYPNMQYNCENNLLSI